jgi:N6-L-threonylcarbamoyladenine synthase
MPGAGPIVLGLETSCDETSAAVLGADHQILGHVILSQDVHEVYGGVVPELAARAHLQKVDSVVAACLERAGLRLPDVDVFAATAGPGLIGALLVGVCWTKAAAYGAGKPWVAVHHMEAHLFAPALVSGGHTLLLYVPDWGEYHLLGETRDDAAGEAFDKVAKLLGLPYPGGPQIQRAAMSGDARRIPLPRPMLRGGQRPGDADYYDFSFSGLKTAVRDVVSELDDRGVLAEELPHVAASFQEAAVEVLVRKTLRAVEQTGCARVLMGGGVSVNSRLREAMGEGLGPDGRLFHASPRLSLDNGAMVARAARFRYDRGEVASMHGSASASLPFPGLVRGGDSTIGTPTPESVPTSR